MKSTPALGKAIIITGLVMCNFSDGFIFGQLSGMVDALHANDSSIRLDDEDISWIASSINVTCFCGFAIMTFLTEYCGRGTTFSVTMVPVVISWIMVYFAQDKFTLLASRIIVGTCYGGVVFLSSVTVGEYISPNKRSLILNVLSTLGSSAGTTLGHVLSIFLHWRNVALIGIIPSAISVIIPMFWIESPSWLISKGKFEECEKAFKSLNDQSEASDKELKMLLEIHRMEEQPETLKKKNPIKRFLEATKHKYFWKISFLFQAITIYRVAAGRVLFNTFAITMIQDIIGSRDILLFTLLIDGFAILGGGISCILVSKFKMRSLLLTSGILANIIQIITAICLYAWPNNTPIVAWIKVALLAIYFITVSSGPYAVLETLLSELHPLDIRSINILYLACIAGIIQFLGIKFAFRMFMAIGYHGVFLLNSMIVFLCLLYLYIYLPETKGKTLPEIEYYFKYNTFEVITNLEEFVNDKENILNKTEQIS